MSDFGFSFSILLCKYAVIWCWEKLVSFHQIKIRTARQWNTFYPHLQGLDLTFEQSFSVYREDFLIHSLLPREGPKMNRMSTESYTSDEEEVIVEEMVDTDVTDAGEVADVTAKVDRQADQADQAEMEVAMTLTSLTATRPLPR